MKIRHQPPEPLDRGEELLERQRGKSTGIDRRNTLGVGRILLADRLGRRRHRGLGWDASRSLPLSGRVATAAHGDPKKDGNDWRRDADEVSRRVHGGEDIP